MKFIRWILVIPVAVLVAWIGWMFLYYPNLWLIEKYTGFTETSFFVRLYIELMGATGFVLGLVWGGAFTAPDNKNMTALVISILAIAVSAWSISLGYSKQYWWSVFAAAIGIIELLGLAYYIVTSPLEAKEFFSVAPWNRND